MDIVLCIVCNEVCNDKQKYRHAFIEGDADIAIVKQVIDYLSAHDNVLVVASDTDILVMLLYHADAYKNVFMTTQTQTFAITCCKEVENYVSVCPLFMPYQDVTQLQPCLA